MEKKPNSCSNVVKIGDLRINIKSNFAANKKIEDVLYVVASVKLKEKTA